MVHTHLSPQVMVHTHLSPKFPPSYGTHPPFPPVNYFPQCYSLAFQTVVKYWYYGLLSAPIITPNDKEMGA